MGEPKLRFKADDGSEFPAWEKKTLGDLGVFVRGLTYDKTQTVETNGVAVMRSNNISSDGTLDYENGVQLVSKEPSEEQLLRKNDIVICMANGSDRLVGKAAKYDGGYKEPSRITVGAFCGIFRSSAPALPWWFQSDEYQRFLYLGKQGGNGALANLKGKDIENISVMFPADIDEQRKIADCLSAVDAVIAAQQAEVDAWEQRKKGVMQKLFSQEVRFKADDGSEFPKWEEKTLGEEGQFYGGLSGKGKDDFDCGNGRFVTYMNVYKNTFASRDAMGRVKVGDAEKQNKVRYGDILFTQSSETVDEVGLSSVYLYNDEPYLNSFCMGYRFNNLDNVCPEFIGYCMRSNEIRKSIMLMGQGISRINLGAKRLATVKYKIPSLPEQRKIADCLSSMDEVIQKAKDELAKWRELKKGLLQQMFV